MTAHECCEFLPWDTEFFGQQIARVVGQKLDLELVTGITRWCEDNAIACLYFLADSADVHTVRLAEQHGFHLVDVRMTFERRLLQNPTEAVHSVEKDGVTIRMVLPEDVASLQNLAKDSYRDSRFYFDPCFPKARCNALYETWIRRSCEGYADVVLVAELESQPVGYITGHLVNECAEGQIGLVGVGPEGRGRGIGTRLVSAALDWFATQGMETAVVVTQGRNIPAQRLYQRCGFVTRDVKLWYHKWFIACEQELAR